MMFDRTSCLGLDYLHGPVIGSAGVVVLDAVLLG